MSVFSTWAENGSTVTQGRGAGEAAAITGSEFGLGQVLDSNWGQHGFVFLPCLGARQHTDLLVSDLSKGRTTMG